MNHIDKKAMKSDVLAALSAKGFSLVATAANKGEWNECRRMTAARTGVNPLHIGTVMKGEKPDWADMLKAFEELA